MTNLQNIINEPLIENGFLNRGRSLLITSERDSGKSALMYKLAMHWALGKDCFGITPKKKIKSIIFQADHDDYDIGEIVQPILDWNRFGGDSENRKLLDHNVQNLSVVAVGLEDFYDEISTTINEYHPDLIWIDPMQTYLGDDAFKPDLLKPFLDEELEPLLKRSSVSCVFMHHSANVITPDRTKWTKRNCKFYGLDPNAWHNWFQSVLLLQRKNSLVTRLIASKGKNLPYWDEDETVCNLPTTYIRPIGDEIGTCWIGCRQVELDWNP